MLKTFNDIFKQVFNSEKHNQFSLFVLAMFCIFILNNCTVTCPLSTNENKINVAVVLPMTGINSFRGLNYKAIIDQAVLDMNAYFSGIKSNFRMAVKYFDNSSESDSTLSAVKQANSSGYKMMIYCGDAEGLSAIKSYIDLFKILVVSTDVSQYRISISYDNIFRLCPDDSLSAYFLTKQIINPGLRSVLEIIPNNQESLSITNSINNNLVHYGISTPNPLLLPDDPANYDNFFNNFNSILYKVPVQNQKYIHIFLYLDQKHIDVLNYLSSRDTTLKKMKCYITGRVLFNPILSNGGIISDYLVSSGFDFFTNIPDPSQQPRWEIVTDKVENQTAIKCDGYNISAYDAVWLIGKSYSTSANPADFDIFKSDFRKTAETYTGINGATNLNYNGVRESGTFGLFRLTNINGINQWSEVK